MDFQNECLHAHNEHRKKHGVPPLKLNREICRFSQEWANYLIKKGVLQHSNNKDYGENLFCIQSSNPNFTINGREPVDNWYDELKCHSFGVEPSSLASGHFTQVSYFQNLYHVKYSRFDFNGFRTSFDVTRCLKSKSGGLWLLLEGHLYLFVI